MCEQERSWLQWFLSYDSSVGGGWMKKAWQVLVEKFVKLFVLSGKQAEKTRILIWPAEWFSSTFMLSQKFTSQCVNLGIKWGLFVYSGWRFKFAALCLEREKFVFAFLGFKQQIIFIQNITRTSQTLRNFPNAPAKVQIMEKFPCFAKLQMCENLSEI